MNVRQILLVLRLRWWLVLLLFVLVMITAFVVTMLTPKQYTADTALLMDVKADPLVATLAPQLASPSYLATQTEIIRSDLVAGRVVRMLGLAQSPAAVAQWREETQGRIPLESYFGSLLQRGLYVEPARGSNILTLSFTGTDPKFAAAAANTFARAYLDLSTELRLEPARQYGTFFDDRLKSLRNQLEASQARLSAYQQKSGIVATDDRVDLETAKLNAIMGQLASAQAELADTTSRQRNSGIETSPDVQASGVVQGLKSQLASAETKLSEISSIVGSSHPQRIALEAQIAELRRQISSEMRRVSGTTATVNRVTGQKIAELASMAEEQKRKVLSLRAERDEMSVLSKDVETAQRAYEAVAQRRTQLSIESVADQASARVLSPAIEPIQHSKPSLSKNMMMGMMGGLALGIGAALALELFDRRVRSASDLAMDERVPVLGVLSKKPVLSWPGMSAGRRLALPGPPAGGGFPRLSMDTRDV
jgi:chain length determinant protein EpsF